MNQQRKIKSPFKKGGMFNEANPLVFELAKELRRNMTDAEMVLWGYLKAGINGLKFRRQHPIGIYIADFYCHSQKLIIEIDGSIHDLEEVKSNDAIRQTDLEELGLTVLRFTAHDVMNNMESLLQKIEKNLK